MARLRFPAAPRSVVLSGMLAWFWLAAPGLALADEPKALIQGEIPPELRELIVRAVGTSKNPPGSRLEARGRARDAADDAKAVLDSAGYHSATVEADLTDDEPAKPVVRIVVGSRFLIRNPHILWQGELPPAGVQGAGFSGIQLDEGAPARAADIVAAEGRVAASIQKLGYADAVVGERLVIADHATNTVTPEYRITAGALVHLDGVDVRTEGRTNPAWVRSLAPWEEGDIYDPDDVAELERRLLDVSVYESVTVSLAPKENAQGGNRPIIVSLAERPPRRIELGAGYSTTEGGGLDGRFLRYNWLGRADTLTTSFRVAEIERKLDVELSLPHWRKAQNTLRVGGGIYQSLTDAYEEMGLNARADITRRYARTSFRTYGVSLDLTRTEESAPVVLTRDLVTLTGLAALTWDRADDPLNPRRGWKFDGRVEPTASAGDVSQVYLRIQAQGSAYYPFNDARTVVAGRVKVGSVIGGSLATIPAARRLYAGGGGSVRGFAYQGVGPRLPDNTPQGGLSVVEASLELRHKFTRRWGGVLFLDAGGVADQARPDLTNVSTGVGVGIRYDLGFGPIRADIAVPVERRAGDPAYQIYLSIGQSF